MCAAIVGGITGTAADIRAAGKVLDLLEFSPDQAKDVGMYQNPDGTMGWSVGSKDWDIGLDHKAFLLVRQAVTGYSGWAARDTKRVDALLEKLAASE